YTWPCDARPFSPGGLHMTGTSLKSVLAARWRLASWGLVLLLGLAVVAVSRESTGRAADEGGLPSDLARVAPDSFFVGSVRVADIWNSGAAKGVRDQAQQSLPELFQEFEKQLGVGVPDIERITMVVHGRMNDAEP